jgi:hypothetical protein
MCSSLGAFSFLEAPARRGFLLGAVSVFGPPPLDAPNQVPSHRVGQLAMMRRPHVCASWQVPARRASVGGPGC